MNELHFESTKTDKVDAALSKAQLEFLPLKKSGRNTFFKDKESGKPSEYSTLTDIMEAVGDALHNNGLVIPQQSITHPDTGMPFHMTTLRHITSGQFLRSWLPLPPGAKAQEIGSNITYDRRFCIQPLLGLECDLNTDDDGNKAQEAEPAVQVKVTRGKKQPNTGVKEICEALEKSKTNDELAAVWHNAQDHLKDLRDDDRDIVEDVKEVMKTKLGVAA